MRMIAIIPARMGSSRFPGKPLARINGVPMIGHVYFRSRLNPRLADVYIATCDDEIREYAESIGAPCVMTSAAHARASDRTAEALEIIERNSGQAVDVVIMIQGDEPMLLPNMIDEAVAPLVEDPAVLVTNLMAPLNDAAEHDDTNEVKVVVDRQGNALYFSREPIPSRRLASAAGAMRKQVCIIPFRSAFLRRFVALEPTTLEAIESVDMLRVLEHGYDVRMVTTSCRTYSVDTRDDLSHVAELLKSDALVAKYAAAARPGSDGV